MSLAVLSIDLEARLAKFEQGMDRAGRLLEKLGSNASTAGGRITAVFAGSFLASAAEEGIKRMIGLFPQLIEGVAKFQDLADETGASAEGLARFQTAADVSGVSVETIAGLTVKLTSNLSKLTDESKGAGQALANLGIPIEEFKNLSPDEQIVKLSAAFNSFADGSAKTSNALALFGKSGAQVLKFFKEFGDGSDAFVRLTNQQIAAADAFGDAAAKQSSEFKQAAQVIAVQFLPAITAIKSAVGEAAAEFVKARSGAKDLSDDKSLREWGFDVAIALGEAVDGIDFLVRRAVIGAKTLGAAGLAIKEAFTPGLLRDSEVSRMEALSDLWKAYSADVKSTLAGQLSLADKIKARADAVRTTDRVPESMKDTRGGSGDLRAGLKAASVGDGDKVKKAAESINYLDKALADMIERTDTVKLSIIGAQLENLAKAAAGGLDPKVVEQVQRMLSPPLGPNAGPQISDEMKRLNDLLLQTDSAKLAAASKDAAILRDELSKTAAGTAKYEQLQDALLDVETAIDALAKTFPNLTAKVDESAIAMQQTIEGALGDSLRSALRGNFDDIGKMWGNLLLDMAARAATAQLMDKLFGAVGAGGTRTGGGWLDDAAKWFSAIQGSANGNAFGRGGLYAFANGGVVSGATPFTFGGGKLGVMGEAGDEGVFPLKRGRDGKLGVAATGGSRAPVVNNYVTVNGDVGQQTMAMVNAAMAKNTQQLLRGFKTGTVGAG